MLTSSVTCSVCFFMFWHNHALPASRRFESEACKGGYCLVTKKYWVFFTYGPCEWTGHDVRSTPAETLHAWKVPGDLWDPEKQVWVEKVLMGLRRRSHSSPTLVGTARRSSSAASGVGRRMNIASTCATTNLCVACSRRRAVSRGPSPYQTCKHSGGLWWCGPLSFLPSMS